MTTPDEPAIPAAKLPLQQLYVCELQPICEENDRLIDGDPAVRDHLRIVNLSLDLLWTIARHVVPRDDAELEALKLVGATFNSGLAALTLARGGLYQPAIGALRHLVEAEFLFDLFNRDRTELEAWASLPERDRRKRFHAREVRAKLDRAYGHTSGGRVAAYAALSGYGVHATPEGHGIMEKNGVSVIRPFASAHHYRVLLEQMAVHVPLAAFMALGRAYDDRCPALDSAERLQIEMDLWRKRYRVPIPTPPP